jgi:excinuclease ABC subunit A
MQAADYLVDVGPDAADQGGRIVAAGPPQVIRQNPHSVTGRYLIDG